MSVIVTVNGVQYVVPQSGDNYNWEVGQSGRQGLSALFQAIASGTLQPTGGSFPLTADIDFGSSHGLKAQFLDLPSASPAASASSRSRLATSSAGKLVYSQNGSSYAQVKTQFDVVLYGADPTGSADSTTAIQNATNDASVNGGVVLFPPGTYKITSAISVKSGVLFRGESTLFRNSGSVIKQVTAGQHAFTFAGGIWDFGWENLNIVSSAAPGAYQAGSYGISGSGAAPTSSYRWFVRHCSIANFERGISCVGTDNGPGTPNWQCSDVHIDRVNFIENLRAVYINGRNVDYWVMHNCTGSLVSSGHFVYVACGGVPEMHSCNAFGADGYVSPTGTFVGVYGPAAPTTMIRCQAEAVATFFEYTNDGSLPWTAPDDYSSPITFVNCVNDGVYRFAHNFMASFPGCRIDKNIVCTGADVRLDLRGAYFNGGAVLDRSGSAHTLISQWDALNGYTEEQAATFKGALTAVTPVNFNGTSTWAAATQGNGNLTLNNGNATSPGIRFANAANSNYGLNVAGGNLQLVYKLGETGAVVGATMDSSGNVNGSGHLAANTYLSAGTDCIVGQTLTMTAGVAHSGVANSGTNNAFYFNTNNTMSGTTRLFQVANNGTNAFGVDPSGKVIIPNNDMSGTPGNVTNNSPCGAVAVASGASSVVVTNSLVANTSIIIPVLAQVDATATQIKNCIPANGSFTINMNAAATANTRITFLVLS